MQKISSSPATPAKPSFERPLVTVDVVIFSVLDDALKVLLVRRPEESREPFPGRWALPGGFVDVQKDQSLQASAERKLLEKTGVRTPYLEQLGSWGNVERDPRGWSTTHAFFALIHVPEPRQPALAPAIDTAWLPVDEACRQTLAFDHADILQAAVDRLNGKVEYTSLPAFLLDEPFTLPELQHTYELVLRRPIDKSAFRKRMLDANFLEEMGETDGGFGRSAMGYKIKDRATPAIFPRTFKAKEAQ